MPRPSGSFTNTPGGYKVNAVGGIRQGLFAPSIEVNNAGLNMISAKMEAGLAKAMLRTANQAKDMARRLAPVKSGALKAGIYVTGLVTKDQLELARQDDSKPAHQMKGHTAGYYRAITAAAKRLEVGVPGADKESDAAGQYVFGRTQRLRKGVTAASITKSGDDSGIEDLTYAQVNEMLPFNQFGSAKRTAFFVGLGSAMFYSAWVDRGTSKKAAKPFFTPAANWMQRQCLNAMIDELNRLDVGFDVKKGLLS